MKSYFFKTFTPTGSHYDVWEEDALKYYENNDGFLILTVTKRLFPTYNVFKERPYLTGRVWLLVNQTPCC